MLCEDICLGLSGFFVYSKILLQKLINFQSNTFLIILKSRGNLGNWTIFLFLFHFEEELKRRRLTMDYIV